MTLLNSIEFSLDSETAVVGGVSGGKCMLVAMPVKLGSVGSIVQYIEQDASSAPTVISRIPGYNIFLVGVGGSVHVYLLEKKQLKKIQKIAGVVNGLMTDMCIKGNVLYLKANKEPSLCMLVFGIPTGGRPIMRLPPYSQRVIRHHHISLNGNLEKIWIDQYNKIVYAGGGLGITTLKKDKVTGQLVQVRSEVPVF